MQANSSTILNLVRPGSLNSLPFIIEFVSLGLNDLCLARLDSGVRRASDFIALKSYALRETINVAKPGLNNLSLMLAIILWGTLLGGVAYSHLVYFPVYLSALPDSAVLVKGPYGLNEGRFWGLIHPLLILSLIATLALNWSLKARRRLILITVALYVLALVATALYFVPELMAFANSQNLGGSPAEWLARGRRWERLSWLRGLVMYVAIVPLLFALATPVGPRKRREPKEYSTRRSVKNSLRIGESS